MRLPSRAAAAKVSAWTSSFVVIADGAVGAGAVVEAAVVFVPGVRYHPGRGGGERGGVEQFDCAQRAPRNGR